ncbi:MAG: DUF5682 family protein [Myxococcota bacterium]
MAEVRIVGVRHHSPACAREVREALNAMSPDHVLIEGPSDMNGRLNEFLLPHQLPIAVYSYRFDEAQLNARGTWTPFCAYSPEWIALTEAQSVGADAYFIDLPAWDDAFANVLNRFGEGSTLSSADIQALSEEHGFDCSDGLWDHLFETEPSELGPRLRTYFEALRGTDEGDARNRAREAYMAEWIEWARTRSTRGVLVVCGGYHAPALRRLISDEPIAEPSAADPSAASHADSASGPPARTPESNVRVGSFLVPFSFHRLDSFAGYASGMPSPAWYQALWDDHGSAAEQMMGAAVRRLREIGQVASTADLAAARLMAEGLARLRGHDTPTRTDTLDGLTSALLKEPLDHPLPWSERAPLHSGTPPLVVELVRVFAGARSGRLAEGTPLPPLVADVHAQLAASDLSIEGDTTNVVLTRERMDARRTLYRLRVLEIPGVLLVRPERRSRGEKTPGEHWRIEPNDEVLPTLIERAVYGATLVQAVRSRLEEHLAQAQGLVPLSKVLQSAHDSGLPHFVRGLTTRVLDAIEHEGDLGAAGEALDTLLALERQERIADSSGTYAPLLEAALERSLWLLEGQAALKGYRATTQDVLAVRAIARTAVDLADKEPDVWLRAAAVFARAARRADGPLGLRGACLGAMFRPRQASTEAIDARVHEAVQVITGIRAVTLGEFLTGLAVTAREELRTSRLLDAVDGRLVAMHEDTFLTALPDLRHAFSFFPPAERLELAERLKHGPTGPVGLPTVELSHENGAIERQLFSLFERYGLLNAKEGAP